MWFLFGLLLGGVIVIAATNSIVKEKYTRVTEHNGEKVVVFNDVMYVLKPAIVSQSPGT